MATHYSNSKLYKEKIGYEKIKPINYETWKIPLIGELKFFFGNRLIIANHQYFVDGKKILLGLLVQKMRNEKENSRNRIK